MREIKFRGMDYYGKWAYGSLVNNLWVESEISKFPGKQVCDILKIPEDAYYDCWDDLSENDGIISVEAESVGQFTGLKDKNDKEIYEGDIIKYNEDAIRVVVFRNGAFHCDVFDWEPKKDKPTFPIFFLPITNNHTEEVIGNIYENPELLK